MRQRRIIDFAEPDMAGKPGHRETFHMVQHGVDVQTLARHRALVGKRFHPVDQFDDPVGLLANQLGQRAIFVADRAFEQLSGAADARKRVFDLMGEHRAERGDRSRRAAMRHLSVHFFGN